MVGLARGCCFVFGKFARFLGLDEEPFGLANMTALQNLNLMGNSLMDTIPSQIGSMTGLEFLNLFANQFFGQVPTELAQLTKLSMFSRSDCDALLLRC